MAQFVDVALAFLSFSFRLFLFQFHYGEEPSALEVHTINEFLRIQGGDQGVADCDCGSFLNFRFVVFSNCMCQI